MSIFLKILLIAKIYEYRKTKCKKRVDSIVIYSTAPIMKVIAEVQRLRAENAYLKKLNALVSERVRQEKKHK